MPMGDNIREEEQAKVDGLRAVNRMLREQNRVLRDVLKQALDDIPGWVMLASEALTATSQPQPPYKEWCRHPDKCAGLASCPQDPTCAD